MSRKSFAVPLVGVLVVGLGTILGAADAAPEPQSVELAEDALVFHASTGVENDIMLYSSSRDDTSTLFDMSGVPLTSTTCEVDGSTAVCPSDGIDVFEIHLGDKDDVVYGQGAFGGPTGTFSVRGGSGDDSIEGNVTYYGDYLNGNKGNDGISGLIGLDDLFGGPGNDHLSGGMDPDRLLGGSGRDEIRGQRHADFLSGGPGMDVLRGGRGRDRIDSKDGVMDHVYGGDGTDTLRKDRFDVVHEVETIVDTLDRGWR